MEVTFSELKVLVVGQAFHRQSGGGVTQSNLFSGWDKSKLFSLPFGKDPLEFDVCTNVYRMGYKSRFPLILLPFVRNKNKDFVHTWEMKTAETGLSGQKESSSTAAPGQSSVKKWLYSLNIYFGLNHLSHRYTINRSLRNWLREADPDIIYAQYSDYASMKFVIRLKKTLKKPLVIHLMDDWIAVPPKTNLQNSASENSLTKKFWTRKYQQLFRKILSLSDQRITVSEAMSEEYEKRYGCSFSWAHNYIDPAEWEGLKPVEPEGIVIGYFGSIDLKNRENFKLLADAIEETGRKDIRMRIFSKDSHLLAGILKNPGQLELNEFVNAASYKQALLNCSLLFLPLGFSEEAHRFVRFSMPTKLGEYLFSGVPVLVQAAEDTALARFCNKYRCAVTVEKQDSSSLKAAIEQLISGSPDLAGIAYSTATERFGKESMLQHFRKILAGSKSN